VYYKFFWLVDFVLTLLKRGRKHFVVCEAGTCWASTLKKVQKAAKDENVVLLSAHV
jgi:hypothetical protein